MNTIRDIFKHFEAKDFNPVRDDTHYPLVSIKFCKNGFYEFRDKEHIFLTGENYQYIQDVIPIRGTKIINEKGKEVLRKKFLLGVQECKITKVSLRKTQKDSLYIAVQFERKSTTINGKRLNFAPFVERFFSIDNSDSIGFKLIQQLLIESGKDLKSKPDNYDTEAYIKAVARRVRDCINKPLKVAIIYSKELVRDDYGELELKKMFSGYDYYDAVTVAFKEEVLYFGNKEFDWSKAIKQFSERDKRDFEIYNK